MKIKSLDEIKSVRLYLSRVGAEPRSLKTAVIREQYGTYWKDLAVIRFKRGGGVSCSVDEFAPTELEAAAMAEEFAIIEWPEIKPLMSIVNPPDTIKNADKKDIFEFRDAAGRIIFVQVRVERDGDKNYIPFSYWDDDIWRSCEPDGALPLFNVDKLKGAAAVFIHEGAKAAQYCQWMVEARTAPAKKALAAHPWGRELIGAVHVGWVGGAMSPYRTDWSVLQHAGIHRAYIIADNDGPGRAAVPGIALRLNMPTFMIQFTDEFPACFDLADEFPTALFGSADGSPRYIGPSWRDCLHPATWATNLISNPQGKPTPALRDSFKAMWAYVEEADMFVCTEMPEIMRNESILNKMLAPFSHVTETSRLIVKAYRGRSTRICYRPGHSGLLVTFRGSSAINLHVNTSIKSEPGDTTPWLNFLEYMFVNVKEREQVKRWCATLIARPDLRMGYGLLLVSERQGIGKTTLGAHILAPLVGYQNVGFPSETDIANSTFNDWMANKRLVIVNEIYSGSSWKAYHALKTVITDRDVTVNQKYMRQYTIENWCHVLACSNSMRALKMENDDRRWFYPEVTEVPWPQAKFLALRSWIEGGGLSIIKDWAENYGAYINPADRAPMTARKKEMIEGSRSEAQAEAAALANCLKNHPKPAAVLMKCVVGWVREASQGRVFDSDYELRKAMTESGVRNWPERIRASGRLQYAIVNDGLWDVLTRMEDAAKADQIGVIKGAVLKPHELMEAEM
ncbi:MAG: DUF5906 domain-containing protein [Gammaproteobacteria bacterium]